MTIACQGHLFWNPTETQILPRIMIKTYGIIAGKRISGSRTPPLRLVARAETQSLNGPAVARPMKAPTSMAKFVKPVLVSFFLLSNFVMRHRQLTNALTAPIVGRRSKCLSLGEVYCQEGTAAPADHKAGEFDNWKGKQFPRNPEVKSNALPWMRIRLEDGPLLLARTTSTKPGVTSCCICCLKHVFWCLRFGCGNLLHRRVRRLRYGKILLLAG